MLIIEDLEEGRYTWHHDSVLYFLASLFQSIKNSSLYLDISGFISPSALTHDILHPDLLSIILDKCFYISDLATGFEKNL